MLNNVLAYHRPHNSVLSVFKTESEVNSSDSQQEGISHSQGCISIKKCHQHFNFTQWQHSLYYEEYISIV